MTLKMGDSWKTIGKSGNAIGILDAEESPQQAISEIVTLVQEAVGEIGGVVIARKIASLGDSGRAV